MFYVSLLIIQIILLDAHFLIYVTVRDMLNLHGEALLILKIISVILSVSFLSMSVIAHYFYNKIVRFLYVIAAIWFGFLMYFLLASALYWVVVIGGGKEISAAAASFAGTLFFAGALCFGIFGIVNANNIRVRRIVVDISHLPESWQKRKVVLISDIHLGQVRDKGFAEKISNIISQISPDIVFFVGDVFDGAKMDTDRCLSPFSNIKTPLGKFFVTGNHEEFHEGSAENYDDALKRVGVRVLKNESVKIDGVEIVGVSDKDSAKKDSYRELLKNIIGKKKEGPIILLKHTPILADVASDTGVDLELSGHTHGGQIFPFNFITPLIFKDRNYGLSKYKSMSSYTSSGVGTWGPPIRIGTTPKSSSSLFKINPNECACNGQKGDNRPQNPDET